ncbi:hypothetical protein EDB89DRAFT_1862097 [Lactarius sanguifluus]|nr:hypothetical protein EDB89DRAFT_1862097 [Lactarius sanguifluus]
MWVVCPDTMCGRQARSVHLDSFLQAAHLIPVYGNDKMPLDLHFSFTLNVFEAY